MANTLRIGFKLGNFSELREMLLQLPAVLEKKVIGVALEQAARPIEKAARRLAAKDTGALRASITHVLRQFRKTSVVIIGPDRDYYAAGKRLKRGDARQGADRPAHYAHLIEFGHLTRNAAANALARKFIKFTARERAEAQSRGTILSPLGRRAAHFVAARPFLRPAVLQGESAAAREFELGVARGLEREIKKLNRKIIKAQAAA